MSWTIFGLASQTNQLRLPQLAEDVFSPEDVWTALEHLVDAAEDADDEDAEVDAADDEDFFATLSTGELQLSRTVPRVCFPALWL